MGKGVFEDTKGLNILSKYGRDSFGIPSDFLGIPEGFPTDFSKDS